MLFAFIFLRPILSLVTELSLLQLPVSGTISLRTEASPAWHLSKKSENAPLPNPFFFFLISPSPFPFSSYFCLSALYPLLVKRHYTNIISASVLFLMYGQNMINIGNCHYFLTIVFQKFCSCGWSKSRWDCTHSSEHICSTSLWLKSK